MSEQYVHVLQMPDVAASVMKHVPMRGNTWYDLRRVNTAFFDTTTILIGENDVKKLYRLQELRWAYMKYCVRDEEVENSPVQKNEDREMKKVSGWIIATCFEVFHYQQHSRNQKEYSNFAVQIVDLYRLYNFVATEDLYLLAHAAIKIVASALYKEEIAGQTPYSEWITNGRFSVSEILKMEQQVLNCLRVKFKVEVPLFGWIIPYQRKRFESEMYSCIAKLPCYVSFLEILVDFAGLDMGWWEKDSPNYYLECYLISKGSTEASEAIACGIVMYALRMQGRQDWNDDLAYFTGFDRKGITEFANMVAEAVQDVKSYDHQYLDKKYKMIADMKQLSYQSTLLYPFYFL